MLNWLTDLLARGAPLLTEVLREHPLALAAVVAGLLASLAGYGLLATALWPERQDRAVAGLVRRPLRDWLLGSCAIALPLALVIALVASGIRPGRFLLLGLAFLATALGLATCARWLGQRLLPGRGPIAQASLGLFLLLLPLASPFGAPVAAVAAPLGLGAWLAARR